MLGLLQEIAGLWRQRQCWSVDQEISSRESYPWISPLTRILMLVGFSFIVSFYLPYKDSTKCLDSVVRRWSSNKSFWRHNCTQTILLTICGNRDIPAGTGLHIDVVSTSSRRIDVSLASLRRHVPVGFMPVRRCKWIRKHDCYIYD